MRHASLLAVAIEDAYSQDLPVTPLGLSVHIVSSPDVLPEGGLGGFPFGGVGVGDVGPPLQLHSRRHSGIHYRKLYPIS